VGFKVSWNPTTEHPMNALVEDGMRKNPAHQRIHYIIHRGGEGWCQRMRRTERWRGHQKDAKKINDKLRRTRILITSPTEGNGTGLSNQNPATTKLTNKKSGEGKGSVKGRKGGGKRARGTPAVRNESPKPKRRPKERDPGGLCGAQRARKQEGVGGGRRIRCNRRLGEKTKLSFRKEARGWSKIPSEEANGATR